MIPSLVARNSVATGADRDGVVEAFRRAVTPASTARSPSGPSAPPGRTSSCWRCAAAVRIYVGIAEDRFVAASEPYGIVEETDRYLRLDGEHGGQFVALDAALAGTLAGVARFDYDGAPAPVSETDLATAEVTTRDIDRGDAAHFLLKEISESPDSLAKTLRGKIADDGAAASAVVGSPGAAA